MERFSFLAMFVPRIQLFFNFLSTIAIIPILCLILTFTSANANRCIVGGLHARTWNLTTTFPLKPENAELQEVGDKWCGFEVYGDVYEIEDCSGDMDYKYIAADVGYTTSGESFCAYWYERVVCVCPFYGCNSVKGTLYEAVISSMTTPSTFIGYYSWPTDIAKWKERRIKDCLLKNIEKFDNIVVSEKDRNDTLDKLPNSANKMRQRYSGLFPKQEKVDELKREATRVHTTTQTTTTRAKPTTSAKAAAKASALSSSKVSGKEDAEETWGVMPLVITIVLFVVVLALVAAMIIAFICFRRKVNDNLTTIRSVASDTSLHGSVMFSPNPNAPPPGGAASNDYFANPNLNSAPVAAVAPNGTAALSTKSKKSGRAGTSPINKSLVAAPNPAPVAQK